MYKELRNRIKASRPIAKRQKVLNIALLAIVLASLASDNIGQALAKHSTKPHTTNPSTKSSTTHTTKTNTTITTPASKI